MRVSIIAGTVMAAVIVLAGGLYLTSVTPVEVPLPPVQVPVETASPAAPAPSGPASPAVAPSSGQASVGSPRPREEVELPLTLEQKIEGFRQAIDRVCASGQSQEVSLVFSEAEANEQAGKLLATTVIETDIPLEITGVKIYFKDDNRVLAEIRAAIYGIKATIKTETSVTIRDGEPALEITHLGFGFLPLPGLVKDKVAQIIRQKLDELKARYGSAQMSCEGNIKLEFTDIDIRQGEAALTLTIRRD